MNRVWKLLSNWRGPGSATDPASNIPQAEGRIDKLEGGILYGWIWRPDDPDGEATANIWLDGAVVLQTTANIFREDLLLAGKGDGRHGFIVDLRTPLIEGRYGAKVQIALTSTAQAGIRLAEAEFRHELKALFDFSRIDIHATRFGPLLSPIVARHFLPQGEIAPSSAPEAPGHDAAREAMIDRLLGCDTTDAAGARTLSRYLDMLRYRNGQCDQFPVETNAAAYGHFLKWYLDAYCRGKGSARAPVSRDEIAFLNETIDIPGQQHSLSRATLAFMLDHPDSISRGGLHSNSEFARLCYWWCVEFLPLLHMEDCLVPVHYTQTLVAIDHPSEHKNFPLSRFARLHHEQNAAFHGLDFSRQEDRAFWYFAIFILGLDAPHLLQFTPPEVINAMLGNANDEAGLLEKISARLSADTAGLLTTPTYYAKLKLSGFDARNATFVTRSARGHRACPAYAATPSTAFAPLDVQIIGPFGKASGLGHASHLSLKALRQTPLNVGGFDFSPDHPTPDTDIDPALQHLRHSRVQLIHMNADRLPEAFAFLPDVFSASYNIGYFFWELDALPRGQELSLELLDEIWVASEFCAQVFRKATSKPVTKVGLPVDPVIFQIDKNDARAAMEAKYNPGADNFVFLATFDSFSHLTRKNPLAALRAFQDAFPGDERVRLIVKTHNVELAQNHATAKIWRTILKAAETDKRIMPINETLSYVEQLRLTAASDGYVSLHRSEGLGLGMMEAMGLGAPVVATAYSGNLEFCNPDTCGLVDYKLVDVEKGEYAYVEPGHKWAEPDHASSVAELRRVFFDRDISEKRALNAKQLMQNRFQLDDIASNYARRLQQIQQIIARPDWKKSQ